MKIPLGAVIPLVAVLVLVVMTGGCSEQLPPAPPGNTVSLSDGQEPFRPITLDEGIQNLEALFTSETDLPSARPRFSLVYLQGRGVSTEGKAEQWIFGVTTTCQNYFVQVESNRQVLVPWQGELPEKEIDLSALVQPGDLLARNWDSIEEEFGPEDTSLVDLELSEGIYAVTPWRVEMYRILYFDAVTGKRI
jgi:hypothetical protein